ncbi:beta strand repeat-containing protein [Caulobacter segnis]|uniref:beta strand repeat-containing protein n=1 Tax=Caulobacter segnis TaxID=88688 RepID=UPI0021D867FC|nr:S-layer protein [Caulobacter segnis]
MAYNVTQLTTFFTNANAGTAPTAAQTLTLQALANQNAAGTLTNDQALASTVDLASDTTTAVSVGTYQFFLGFAPSQAGLTSLNSAYVGTGSQAGLNGENRFIAQAVSLALQNTTAKASFAASYGSLSVVDATKAAYNIIIGNSAAAAAGINVDNSVAYLTSATSIAYYTAFVKANVPGLTTQADIDLAVKAAIVGEILYAATTYNNGAGLGSYATASTNLIKDLADDGALTANNAAGIDLFASYGPGGVGSTLALTTGIDGVVGTSGNDTITGTNTTVTGLDTIDGAGGVDTVKLGDVAGAGLDLSLLTVKNVEKLELTSVNDLKSNAADVSGWTGLTSASFSLKATTGQTITAASTTALTVSNTTAFGVTVVGSGGALSISNGAGAVVVGGTAVANGITSATVSGGTTVAITDRSGASAAVGSTLTKVSVDGNTGTATLTGDGLTSVSVSNTTAATTVVNTTASHALTVTANNVTGGATITDATATSVTLNTVTKASNVNLDLDLATSLTVNAGATTTLTTTALAADDKLKTLTLTGAAAVTADVSGISSLTSVDASGNTKGVNVTLDATTSTFTGSGAADTLTIAAAPTKAIAGGAGTDTLVLNVAAGTFSNPSLNANISGFEILGLGTAATGSYNATGFAGLSIANAVAGAVTFTNVAAGAGLTISAAPTAATTVVLADASGTSDTFAVTLSSAAAIAAGSVTLAGVETVTINATDTDTTAHTDTMTLVATSATKLTVTGSAGLNLTNTGNTALKTVDASANTGGLTYVSAATTGSTSITGSATAVNSLTGGVTADTIVGGSKADTITSGTGLDILTGGAGADTFVLSSNAAGNTYATITDFAVGTGGDTINIASLVSEAAIDATATKITSLNADTAVFQDYLDAGTAATDVTTGNTSHVKWFVYGGNTYVVIDNSDAATFQNGADQVIKLTGLVDLSTNTATATTFVGA